MSKTHVGIDVAKDRLDVWVWEADAGESVPHNEAGIDALCARPAALNQDSGRYRGQRRVWGGRASVRTIPCMTTVHRHPPQNPSQCRELSGQGPVCAGRGIAPVSLRIVDGHAQASSSSINGPMPAIRDYTVPLRKPDRMPMVFG